MSLATSCAADDERQLSKPFLFGDAGLVAPVAMHEYAMPADVRTPRAVFSGSLRLESPERKGDMRILIDAYDRASAVGEPLRHLPEFDFRFVQRGHDLVPMRRGVIRREHPYWEIILQPGRAWQEAGDGEWTRASLPFALQERSANCTHNGVMTWLFNAKGDVSRVVYQVSSETCGYLKFDMWGVVVAEYRKQNLQTEAEAQLSRLDAHRSARLPVRPLADLGERFPGIDAAQLATGDDIPAKDLTVYGLVVDGVHYRSACATRHGAHPYCDSLPLPSYSTAKSIFAGVATMRLEKLYPGISQSTIASLVRECDLPQWRDVTIEDALDMATGNYESTVHPEDEDSAAHDVFVFSGLHEEKLDIACNLFDRRSAPGSRFAYHTSDTYLVGTALQNLVAARKPAADLYNDVLVEPFWQPLELSPLLDSTKRTYDQAAISFAGYGLTYEADDIVRIAAWLNNEDARLNGESALDPSLLAGALQRNAGDRGIATGMANLNYNNGFWAFDVGPLLGCERPAWVPFMSGVYGITVAMFPNGIVYYYFSDSDVFRWRTGIQAAHKIRSLC
jgi:hypothetical protein